jgi:membrane protein implicated in regulation of membrane protease activity
MGIQQKTSSVSSSAGLIGLATLACAGCCAPVIAPLVAPFLTSVLAWAGIAGVSVYSQTPPIMLVAGTGISVSALPLIRRYLKRRTKVSCKGLNCSAETCKEKESAQ